ncbi:MAG: BON domain-containing protein [Phenylobacterium sp.]|uniref:BON domain-containing protein n=1 Tax=Phenylobacterium sp. TaxID=1871053 RepID=UPI001222B6A7|nr:BON domain-containing protein [Phenylobacterium sp.]TAJ69837.1 MAG: BON domain-containing protein [Phenylobacterium sp.]
MDDKALKKLIADELEWEPSIDAADIGVTVENGIVRLVGHVANYAQKGVAEMAVKRVKGVRGFVEDLEIRPFPKTFTDEGIANAVANLLDWNVTVPKNAIKVKVESGVVTLSGDVPWAYQRVAAEQSIRRLQGVRGVANAIMVKPQAQASDIKRRIEQALERQADLEADKVYVTVDGGKVKLDGRVRAWFEREIIERAAWAAPGVSSVDDRVTVSS